MELAKEFTLDKVVEFKAKSREKIKTKISISEYVSKDKVNFIYKKVNILDFTSIGYKLIKEYAWTEDAVNRAIPLYKQWLTLQIAYPDFSFAPSELVDEFWHMHILDTKKYFNDCLFINNSFIHHYPYFGLTDQENESVLNDGFSLTKQLYMHHFGHADLGLQDYKSASCGCRSGNGGSCR